MKEHDKIIATNKLMAEFVELETGYGHPSKQLNYKFGNDWFEEEELSFEVSADWIIPVIEKIDHTVTVSSDEKEPYYYSVSLQGDYADVIDGKTGDAVVKVRLRDDIKPGYWIRCAYKLAWVFLNWYNHQKAIEAAVINAKERRLNNNLMRSNNGNIL